jgi:hypothetical protein
MREAFDLERQAAERVRGRRRLEPTRSILFRSAATLGLQCKEYREAERLACAGLEGSPPDDIADELRDVLEQVHFERHLAIRGTALAPAEFQIAISGSGIGAGMAPTDVVVSRVSPVRNMMLRTAERRVGREYRDRGSASRSTRQVVETYLSAPRAGSFAVTMRLGGDQLDLFEGAGEAEDVLDEVVTCLDLFSRDALAELEHHIANESYFRNFVGLAGQLRPDGEVVSQVGITARIRGRERRVSLRAQVPVRDRGQLDAAEPLSALPSPAPKPDEVVSIRGHLRFADSTKGTDQIKLVPENETPVRVRVPEGMMSDIVKPLWDQVVVVTGRMDRRGTLHLEEIRAARGPAPKRPKT